VRSAATWKSYGGAPMPVESVLSGGQSHPGAMTNFPDVEIAIIAPNCGAGIHSSGGRGVAPLGGAPWRSAASRARCSVGNSPTRYPGRPRGVNVSTNRVGMAVGVYLPKEFEPKIRPRVTSGYSARQSDGSFVHLRAMRGADGMWYARRCEIYSSSRSSGWIAASNEKKLRRGDHDDHT